jgi:hypothetical protein
MENILKKLENGEINAVSISGRDYKKIFHKEKQWDFWQDDVGDTYTVSEIFIEIAIGTVLGYEIQYRKFEKED